MKPSDWEAYNNYRMCFRKKRYRWEGQARREAHRQHQREYKCPLCHYYHLTKKGAE